MSKIHIFAHKCTRALVLLASDTSSSCYCIVFELSYHCEKKVQLIPLWLWSWYTHASLENLAFPTTAYHMNIVAPCFSYCFTSFGQSNQFNRSPGAIFFLKHVQGHRDIVLLSKEQYFSSYKNCVSCACDLFLEACLFHFQTKYELVCLEVFLWVLPRSDAVFLFL